MAQYRPAYHFLPEKNWMNDPNGLVQYRGVYHLYYQYNPGSDQWGDIHWGHATSLDMVDWREQPIAMKPSLEMGEKHCFSGNACKGHDGRPVFYYTSVGGGAKTGAEQWLALPEGDDLRALHKTNAHAMKASMHGGLDVQEWRDPCVIPHNGGFLMTLGCRLEDRGACLLYTSENGKDFAYHSVLARAESDGDYTWECPNFFPLGDRFVLIYSPGRAPEYLTGTLTADLRFVPESRGVLDQCGWGNFYAPQCFLDERGREIIIGWMTESARGEWKGISGWNGCQSLPRELYLEGGRLKMRAIEELGKLKTSLAEGALPLAGLEAGNQYWLSIDAQIAPGGSVEAELLRSPDGREVTTARVFGDGRMELDRTKSSLHPGVILNALEGAADMPSGRARIEIFVDHSVIEMSCNGDWISARAYPAREDARGLAVRTDGATGRYALRQMRACEK